MISYTELKKGVKIILEKQPYEIIESRLLFKGRGHSVCQAKLKNLVTGNAVSRTFHPSDSFEEADVSELKSKFIYFHRDKYIFEPSRSSSFVEIGIGKRFELSNEQIGDNSKFLKPNQEVKTFIFDGKIINISIPIKIELKVTGAPPGIQGGRSRPGSKLVTLETGAKVNTPLFIETGDVIQINTETGEYVRRIK